jgi:hypothetical protein
MQAGIGFKPLGAGTRERPLENLTLHAMIDGIKITNRGLHFRTNNGVPSFVAFHSKVRELFGTGEEAVTA